MASVQDALAKETLLKIRLSEAVARGYKFIFWNKPPLKINL